MSTRLDDLYRLQKKDVRRAAVTLADAFRHDPVWNAVFGDATPAPRAYAFETPVRYGLKYGEVYAPSEALEGIAAWAPGELADMTFWRILRSGAFWSGMKIGARIASKMQPVFRPIETDRKEHMRGKPYIYLQVIGVAPAFQGQGFAGKLLRALIEEGEQAGVSLYLETETEANVSLYEHFGFTVIKKITLPIIDLPMWEMVRDVSKERLSEDKTKEQA
jgi:ribosomal protein S18 acetylase RimI-like enzyme